MREEQLSCKLISFRPSTSTFLPAKRNKKGSAHCLFIPANNAKHKGRERLIGCAANGGQICVIQKVRQISLSRDGATAGKRRAVR